MDAHHMRRRDEEEEELMNVIIPYIFDEGPSERRRCHTSILTGAAHVREALEGHEALCRREFRMDTHIFRALMQCLREKDHLRDTQKGVTVEEQLGMFLYTLARNASNRSVQTRFQHSGETVHRHFKEVLSKITNLALDYICLPSTITPPEIRYKNKFFPYFKDCIGAIDGTHIPISISLDQQEPYRNRKGSLSQNVMVACDFGLRFVYVRAGWEGSAFDARILQDSLSHGFRVPRGTYYLVDAGYANTPQFIAPYRGVHYHLLEQARTQARPQNAQELFNLRHASLRNHVERIIGILKMRFPILKVPTLHPIDFQRDIVIAACVIHNFIRIHNGDTRWLNNNMPDIDPNDVVDVPDGDDEYANDIEAMNNQRNMGAALRDRIAQEMWADYCRTMNLRNS